MTFDALESMSTADVIENLSLSLSLSLFLADSLKVTVWSLFRWRRLRFWLFPQQVVFSRF